MRIRIGSFAFDLGFLQKIKKKTMKTTKDFIKKYGLPTETGKLYLKTMG